MVYPGVLIGGLVLASLIGSALWEQGRRRLVVAGAVAGLALAAGVGRCVSRSIAATSTIGSPTPWGAGSRRCRRTSASPGGMSGWSLSPNLPRHQPRRSRQLLRVSRGAPRAPRRRMARSRRHRRPRRVLRRRPPCRVRRARSALPERVHERFRMEFDYVGPLASSGSPRRRVSSTSTTGRRASQATNDASGADGRPTYFAATGDCIAS